MRSSKKSQMEILGLAIVVVLILLATIFVVRFFVLKNPNEYRKSFISAQLASNMLNTFLKTSAKDCSDLTMTELLQDCSQAKSIVCSSGLDSCSYVKTTAQEISKKTLEKWNYNYEFIAYTDINSPLIRIGKPCLGDKRSKLFPVSISSATLFTKLDICN